MAYDKKQDTVYSVILICSQQHFVESLLFFRVETANFVYILSANFVYSMIDILSKSLLQTPKVTCCYVFNHIRKLQFRVTLSFLFMHDKLTSQSLITVWYRVFWSSFNTKSLVALNIMCRVHVFFFLQHYVTIVANF